MPIDEQAFRASYNRYPFDVENRLHVYDVFPQRPLFELIRRLPASQVVCRPGRVPDGALDLEDARANLEPRRV